MVSVIEELQSSESSSQTVERTQSSPIEVLAIVIYTLQPQYAHSIILESEVLVEISIMEEPSRLADKGKAPTTFESQSQDDAFPNPSKEAPSLPKAADEVSSASRSSSATHPSTSYSPSTEDMNALKMVVLAYTSFMDKDISRVSADSKKELLARFSEDLTDALKRPFP
ncbi:hypothetical protein Adt_27555 [Abeliophyllum distichum]|uniref:Uncharacterized protein n=1 Tax=Abeliophyllum distichum TaxID=126358 RepID=A0ABD1RU28_9LAMI